MTNYVGFINSMLDLRQQKLREEIAKAEMQQQQSQMFAKQMSSLGNNMSSMFGQMGQNMQQGRQDAMANSLMNRVSPPSADAVDPRMQETFTGQAGAPAVGGMDEFKMRMAIEGMRGQQMRAQAAQQRVDFLKDSKQVAEAQKWDRMQSQSSRNAFNDSMNYETKMGMVQKRMDEAETQDVYDNAAKTAVSLNRAAQKAGLEVEPLNLQPFMSPADKAALKTQQENVATAQQGLADAQKGDPGMSLEGTLRDSPYAGIARMFGADINTAKQDAIADAQARFELEQKTLREMPGGAPRANTPAVTPEAQAGTGGSMDTISSQEASAKAGKPIKPGTVLTDKNGRRILVN